MGSGVSRNQLSSSSIRHSLDIQPSVTFNVFEAEGDGSQIMVQEKIEDTGHTEHDRTLADPTAVLSQKAQQSEPAAELAITSESTLLNSGSEDDSGLRDLPPFTDDPLSGYSTEAVANELAAARRARLWEHKGWSSSLARNIETLPQLKTNFPAVQAEDDLYKHQERVQTLARAEHLAPRHDETLSTITGSISTIAVVSSADSPRPTTEEGFRQAKAALWEILGLIKDTLDVGFSVDLSDFCNRQGVPIDSFVTVTTLSGAAFANTAACYVSWRWGQKGMRILHWLPKVVSAAPPLRIEDDKDAGPVCIELRGELTNRPAATLNECNASIRVKWIKGRMKDYDTVVANVALQLAWILAAFKKGPDDSLSFPTAEIPSNSPDDDRCSNFQVVHCDAVDQLVEDNSKCWHQLFAGRNVAVGFPIPYRPDGMQGVEMPFSLMTMLAGVGDAAPYGPGLVLKGQKSVLFPIKIDPEPGDVAEADSRQWHLHLEEVEESEFGTLPNRFDNPTEENATEFLEVVKKPKRHFLGLYQRATILTGTNDAKNFKVSSACDQDGVVGQDRRGRIEWNRTIRGCRRHWDGMAHPISPRTRDAYQI